MRRSPDAQVSIAEPGPVQAERHTPLERVVLALQCGGAVLSITAAAEIEKTITAIGDIAMVSLFNDHSHIPTSIVALRARVVPVS
jgi:hypothetical protein